MATEGGASPGNSSAERAWWWFSVGREEGGPTYYGESVRCPSFVWNFDTFVCVSAFSLPMVTFFILLPSFRHKHWGSFFAMVICLLTGFVLVCAYDSSAWVVGIVDVYMPNGPKQPPSNGTLGLWAGLSHVNLTYVSANLSFNEQITWSDRRNLFTAHRMALERGWVWPLVSILSELSGEGRVWRGSLGNGMRYAGACGSAFMLASMYVWAVIVVLLSIAPDLSARPLMFMGVLLASASLNYVFVLWLHIPKTIIIGGARMQLYPGWAWYSVCFLSIVLTVIGSALVLYEFKYPKKLFTLFELHAGTPYHRLFREPENTDCDVGPLDEDYRKVYPPCYWNVNRCDDKEKTSSYNDSDTVSRSESECNSMQSMEEERKQSKKTYVKRVYITADTGILYFCKSSRRLSCSVDTVLDTPGKVTMDRTPQRLPVPTSLRQRITPDKDRSRSSLRPSPILLGCTSPMIHTRQASRLISNDLAESPLPTILLEEASTPM